MGYAFVNDKHRVVNELIYKAGYTYQTHAYMITQDAAIKIAQIENLYTSKLQEIVPDAKKFSLDDQFSIPVSEFIDTTFPVISLKNKFCELKSG